LQLLYLGCTIIEFHKIQFSYRRNCYGGYKNNKFRWIDKTKACFYP